MEETKQSRGKVIMCVILSIILIVSIGIGIYFAVKKDDADDGGVTGTEVELACYAINKVNERASVIYDTYAKSSAGDSDITLGGKNITLNGSDVITVADLNNYFQGLRMCNTVPAAMDFVINSSNSEVYTNTFELGKTYMARQTYKNYQGKDQTDIYYYKVEKKQTLVNCFLSVGYGDESAYYVCQINYDFSTDKLLSAKTIVWMDGAHYLMLDVDYQRNEFTAVEFGSSKSIKDLMNNNIKFSDIELVTFYRGNIVNNINSIEFEDFSKNTNDVENVFNAYYNNFGMGIEYENLFDYDNFVINNSFIDAMEYSTNKLDFYVRTNPDNKFEFQYISTWIEYEDVVTLLNDLSLSSDLNDKPSTKQLIIAYKNRLIERGKYSYTGTLSFEYDDNNFLDIVKVKDEINAYLVAVVTDDEGLYECQYKYNNGKLESSDASSTSVEFTARASQDGTYAIITDVESRIININVPAEIEVGGNMLPVKEFAAYCYGRNGMILNIPASVEEIELYYCSYNLREINVDPNNANYSSKDGILYNKDGSELLCYPGEKNLESFTIPTGVVTVNEYAFTRAGNLKTLIISASVKNLNLGSSHMPSLTAIQVSEGSTTYSSYDGILYTENGEELLWCPSGKSGVVNVRYGTKIIGQYSFWYNNEITQLVLPNTLTTIRYAFGNCEKLKTIEIPSSVTSIEFGSSTKCFNKMIISSNNTAFAMDENNFVYSKDMKTLYFVPGNISGVVTIPNHVTEIGRYVFSGREGITEIVVPESVTSLQDRAFGYYSGARKITFQGTIELDSWNYGPFSQAYDLEELYIKQLTGDFEWEILDDCEKFHTITYGGTKADFKGHVVGDYNLDNIITVSCTDGDLTYIKE